VRAHATGGGGGGGELLEYWNQQIYHIFLDISTVQDLYRGAVDEKKDVFIEFPSAWKNIPRILSTGVRGNSHWSNIEVRHN
jgi:hypothetical protein